MEIRRNMVLADIININRKALDVFEKYGMTCITCNGVYSETLEAAARANKIDIEKILLDLNKLFVE